MFKARSSSSLPSQPIEVDDKLTTEGKLLPSGLVFRKRVYKRFAVDRSCVIQNSDCFNLLKTIPDEYVDLTISSPPYCMGKEYERTVSIKDFVEAHEKLFPEIHRVTAVGGSICWQVGYHATKGTLIPLDFLVYQLA